MTVIPSAITAELVRHADGGAIAYIDATAVAVFTYQQPDGTYVIDIRTRDDIECGRLRLLLDGQPLPTRPAPCTTSGTMNKPQPERSRSQGPSATTSAAPFICLRFNPGAARAAARQLPPTSC